uniref:Uncharacterized protein n=1 Tax=Cajanus cajan TaxID=3821 RepID=A0A151R0V2_CAJCA|nr:hypothetical protein KK1_042781 [Cajanus cajan]
MIVMGYNVKRVLVDQGSSADILFWEAFAGMKIPNDRLLPYTGTLVGFAGDQVMARGNVKIGTSLTPEDEERLVRVLKDNVSAFAWHSSDMPGIDLDFLCHKLAIDPSAKAGIQEGRKFGEEKRRAIAEETQKLVMAGHVREI